MIRRCLPWGLLLAMLVMGLVASAQDADAPKAPRDIYVLIGQSNMAGRVRMEPGVGFPAGKVFVLNDKDAWQVYTRPSLNHFSTIRKSAAQLGPGYTFAQAMLKAQPDVTLGFVANARGGSSINQWQRGQKYYTEIVRRTRLALEQGGELKAFLWHQGETDYKDPDYLNKLTTFITDLRAELNCPDAPFIAGQINPAVGKEINARIAQLPQALPHCYAVSAEGLTCVDQWHFDRPSIILLGQRYAEQVLAIQKAETEKAEEKGE